MLWSSRQNIQPGFSALELVMVMAISAIIMTSLFEIYNQIMHNMQRVDRFVQADTHIVTLKNRFESDLMGISAIWFTQADLAKKKEDQNSAPAHTQSSKDAHLMSRYFYSMNKNGNLDMITFITTSALQSYDGTQNLCVRVVYKIEQDPKHEKSLRLMRKEIYSWTENIGEQDLKSGKFYELASDIASIEMTYHLIDTVAYNKQQEEKKAKDSAVQSGQQNQNVHPLMRTVKEWKEDQHKESDKKNKKEKDVSDDVRQEEQEDLAGAVVPKIVEMKIIFNVPHSDAKKEYVLSFYIPSTIETLPRAIKNSQKPAMLENNSSVPEGNKS
jgi:prepilin-type N-terminal cleavage/methylation domain-containing protein